MHEHFDITHSSKDGLLIERWKFYLSGTNLILNTYFKGERKTKRHSYQPLHSYNRIMSRDSTIKVDDIPLPEDVKQEAIDIIISKLEVKK